MDFWILIVSASIFIGGLVFWVVQLVIDLRQHRAWMQRMRECITELPDDTAKDDPWHVDPFGDALTSAGERL